MSREIIHTADAPEAIGPYSQAVKVGDIVYLSGQIPLVPETMTVIEGDFNTQVRRVFDNLSAVAKAAGGSLQDIVKLNIYLTDLSYFGAVNDIMTEYFEQPYPARAAIGVASLPKDVPVEMDAVLHLNA
jgi:reactive intermediate/imine deaminase